MPAAGDLIADKYRLVAPLGDASKATVWLAEHTMLQTPVAVKFVPRTRGEVAVKRFLAEAKAAGSVRHQHVVDIIDFGATDKGEPYMVLEFLRGETLRARLDREPPLSPDAVVHIGVHVLSGLAAVHDAGIVHRDVRPENVFLVEEADGQIAKLLDFGVSKSLSAEGATTLTMEGDVLGSPLYVSPEQLRGDRDLDARADLFSVGVVLYEALVGHRPYDGSSFREVVRERNAEVPPVAAFFPALAPLSEVVARAMARDRDARFEDARSMRAALLEAASAVDAEVMQAPGPARGSLRRRAPAPAPSPEAGAAARPSGAGKVAVIAGLAVVALGAVVQLAVPGGWPVLLGLSPRLDNPGVSGAIAPVDGGTVERLSEIGGPEERSREPRAHPRQRRRAKSIPNR
ncbi:MAG TPA: serine/threonine-protein kinase [Sandaracinaceae bacterium]